MARRASDLELFQPRGTLARDAARQEVVVVTEHGQAGRLDVRDHLRADPVVWLSTVRADGRPHVVPTWFAWDGEVIRFFSKPWAQKVRNIRERPDVMLAIGEPDEDFDVELIEARGEVLAEETDGVLPDDFLLKYADLMSRGGLDRTAYVRTYSQPVVVTPTRFVGYGGKGWQDPGASDVAGHMSRPPDDRVSSLLDVVRTRAADPNVTLAALDE